MVALNKFFQKLSWDVVGFSASAVCAVHCLALPLFIMMGSFSSLGFLHNHILENAILTTSGVIGFVSLIPSYFNHHRKMKPLMVLLSGLVLIGISRFYIHTHWETLLTTGGASLVAVAHYINWKYSKLYCADEAHSHSS